jgi:hypothetical protein
VETKAPNDYARTIGDVELPPTVRTFVDRYDRVVGHRDRFLWKWIHNLFDEFTLSCVPHDVRDEVRERKSLLTILVTTLDDLAERNDGGDAFDHVRWIPFERPTHPHVAEETVDPELYEFVADLWEAIESGIERAPRYGEFADVFEYDLGQTVNAMAYARLLNDNPAMANRTETDRYDAYNMSMFPYACLDLMHAPAFERRELGALRSLLSELQQMARIGNWLTTWERELAEGDFSSGIVVCAIRRRVITASEAKAGNVEALVDRITAHGIESEFIREWEIRQKAARKQATELRSVDGEALVTGLETVMNHHLASDGYK